MTSPDPLTFRIPRLRGLAASLAFAALGGLATPGVAATLDTAPCDAEAFATVLHAAPDSPSAAGAYWLDRRLLQWPGQVADDGSRFRLHHSADGGITADVGSAVSGADGAVALEVSDGGMPEALAARFGFIDDGVALALAATEA